MAKGPAAVARQPAEPPALQAWPADKVERRAVGSLKAHPRNPKQHSEAQVQEIMALITAYGWTVPVLIDEKDTILAGHGRVMAAVRLGLVEVPCVVVRGLSAEHKLAYVIADNKVPENGSWDNAMLRADLLELQAADVTLTGFSGTELAAFLEGTPELAPPTRPKGGQSRLKHTCPQCGHAWTAAD